MKQKLLFILIALSVVACGSLNIKDKEKNVAAVSKVHRSAIIAFSQEQPTPNKIGYNLLSGKTAAKGGQSGLTESSEYATKNYATLVDQLNKAGFQVLSLNEMLKNPAYKEAYKSTMEGWQNKFPPGEGMNRFTANNVMEYESGRILGVTGRDNLAKKLNVEAVVIAKVNVMLEGSTVMGIGNRYPQANVSLSMYQPGAEKAVWFETFKGIAASESVGKTAFFDEVKVSQLSIPSAQDAMTKISKSAE